MTTSFFSCVISLALAVGPPETLAAAGEAHLRRATALRVEERLPELEAAHRDFEAAYLKADEDPRYLCRALAAAEFALRSAPFRDEQERVFWQELRDDDLQQLKNDAKRQGRANCRFDAAGEAVTRGKPRPLVAARPPAPPVSDPPASDAPASDPSAGGTPTRVSLLLEPAPQDSPLLDVPRERAKPRATQPRGAEPAAATRPSAPAQHAPEDLGARRLIAAGITTLTAGFAATGVAGYTGARTLGAAREALSLGAEVGAFGTTEQVAQSDALRREYRAMGTATLVLSVSGAVALVVGAVLVGVGRRRLTRAAARVALVPTGTGLGVFTRF